MHCVNYTALLLHEMVGLILSFKYHYCIWDGLGAFLVEEGR
jgi:hypothetical protein